MNLLESLALVLAIVVISAAIAYNLQKGSPSLGDFTEDLDEDLVEKPKRAKRSPKVFDEQATINVEDQNNEVVMEPAKPKKKKKYYPTKPKTN